MKKTINSTLKLIITALVITFALSLSCYCSSLDNPDAYMLLIPSNITGIQYDGSHLSGEYSTDEYYVLTYQIGDHVSVKPSDGKYIEFVNATDSSVFTEFTVAENGSIEFNMPGADLYLKETDSMVEPTIPQETSAPADSSQDSVDANATANETAIPEESEKSDVTVYNSLETGYMTVACTEDNIVVLLFYADGSNTFLSGKASVKTKNEITSIYAYSDFSDSPIVFSSFAGDGTKIDNSEVFADISSNSNMMVANMQQSLVYAPDYGVVVSYADLASFPQTSVAVEEVEPQTEEVAPVAQKDDQFPVSEMLTTGTVSVSGNKLNIRKEPSKDAEKVGEFHNSDTVNIIGKYEGEEVWYKVSFTDENNEQKTGYVFGKYVSL